MTQSHLNDHRIPVGITFPPSLLNKIDEKRKGMGMSRSEFVVNEIEKTIDDNNAH